MLLRPTVEHKRGNKCICILVFIHCSIITNIFPGLVINWNTYAARIQAHPLQIVVNTAVGIKRKNKGNECVLLQGRFSAWSVVHPFGNTKQRNAYIYLFAMVQAQRLWPQPVLSRVKYD